MNLLDRLEEQFSEDVVKALASAVGEKIGSTERALGVALPAILDRLTHMTSTEQGTGDLFGLLRKLGLDGTRLGSAAAMLSGLDAPRNMAKTGVRLVEALFGAQHNTILASLASFAGIGRDSAGSLLNLVAPLVADFVSRQAAGGQGLTAQGLGDLLNEQGRVSGRRPEGLTPARADRGVLSSSALNGTGGTAFAWVKWALPLAALVLLAWGLRNSGSGDPVGGVAAATADGARAAAPAPAITSVYGVDLGALVSRRLPNGVDLKMPSKGVEAQLIDFIQNPAVTVSKDQWFTLDRIEFETSSAVLKQSATYQLRSIVEILKAYPSVKVKVGGYTDNTGNPAANLRLSEERASNTREALVNLGAAPERLMAEGYGEEHPVASNETGEGRQRNRRIDVRVISK